MNKENSKEVLENESCDDSGFTDENWRLRQITYMSKMTLGIFM